MPLQEVAKTLKQKKAGERTKADIGCVRTVAMETMW